MARRDWKGDIIFSHSMAIFRGYVGDNRLHSHWASQLTISLEEAVAFETASGVQSSKAIYFPSKTEHRLISGFVCSIYFDPLSESMPKALNKEAADGWSSLSLDDLPEALATSNDSTDLRALLNAEALSPSGMAETSDDKLQKVIQQIKHQLGRGEDIDRDSLAALVHLSPTRFSHWFVERTGVPLRSYKKWLKLRVAVDAVLNGKNPMEAAMLAGFSDLAHMSRAFSESFGFTYMDALRAWEQSNLM